MSWERALADAPRWLFLGILVFAPLAYGCTGQFTLVIFNQFAVALMVLWAAACAYRRRWPEVPPLVLALVTGLLLQGWWLAWNAHSVHRYRPMSWTTVNRYPDPPPFPALPGAIDRDLSHFSMLTVTAVLVLFVFACDLMQRAEWRKRVWRTLALSAFAVAVLGLLLKAASPEVRLAAWMLDEDAAKADTTFALYRYHGNAASLMSMGWALVLGFVIVAAEQRRRPLLLTGWVIVLLGLLAGLFVNTSRAGWVFALGIAGLVGLRYLPVWWRTMRERIEWRAAVLQGVLVAGFLGVLIAVGLSANWKEKLERLQTMQTGIAKRYPTPVYNQMARETSWYGNGADCFPMAAPPYMEAFGLAEERHGFWRHAHNDYYEYLVNWGWGGGCVWVVLVGGGLVRGLAGHFRSPALPGSTQWMLGFCGCVALLTILVHACWDFPLEKASTLLYFLTLLADAWAPHDQVVAAPSSASAG